MPQPLRLPFRFQLNAPISSVLKNNQPEVRYNKELIFVANRILKSKLKAIFKTIKNQQLRSPDSYLKFILSSFKLSKKQIKITYNPYTVSHVPQPPTAKTPIFCLRVKAIKQDAFLKLKEKFISIKNYQVQSVVDNKLNQLLNHFVPKVQQKVYAYGFRAILAYSKEQKGKYTIVKLLDKLSNNIKKRLFYSQFINRIKSTLSKQNKKKIAIFKLMKITKTFANFHKQVALRKIQVYQQSLSLQSQVAEKKTRISKIYDLNMQRTVILQQQREALRNLKYKLDHQTIEKNHVMTEKRRSLMLARTKLNEEGKVLNEDENSVRADVYKLQKALSKEQSILEKVDRIKSFVRDMKRKGVDFQSLAVGMYKSLHDLMNEDRLDLALDIVKTQQLRHNVDEESGIPTLESISSTRQYECRRILLLQKIVEGYEQKKQSFSLNSSRLRPLAPSLSTSQLKPSPSAISLKGSRLVQQGMNVSMVNKARPDPPELLRLKEEFLLLQSFMTMVLKKCYDLKIKEAIQVELQHLSELLANDMKEYE